MIPLSDKANCLTATEQKKTDEDYFLKSRSNVVAIPIGLSLSDKEMDYMVRDTKGKYSDRWAFLQKPDQENKAMCITANISKGVPYNICAEVLNINPSGHGINGAVLQVGGKCRTLTTNKGEGYKIIEPIYLKRRNENE